MTSLSPALPVNVILRDTRGGHSFALLAFSRDGWDSPLSVEFSPTRTPLEMASAGTQGRKRLLREEDMTKVEFETSEEVDVTPTFDTMGLREDLLRGIYAYGRSRIGCGLVLTREVSTHCDKYE